MNVWKFLSALSVFLIVLGGTSHCATDSNSTCFGSVRIVADSVALPGSTIVVSIVLEDSSSVLGGYNLLIEYDLGVLVFDSASPGSLIAGQWSYFSSRQDLLNPEDPVDRSVYVRLVALADTWKQKSSLSDSNRVGPGELAKLFFYVSERKEYVGTYTYLRFIWIKCDDNSFADKSGKKLLLSKSVRDAEGNELKQGADKYSGAADNCISSAINPPLRAINFRSTRFSIGHI